MITITFDTSDFGNLTDELRDHAIEEAEGVIMDIFAELTAPPPIGTPVDTAKARQGWHTDLSDPEHPEVYNGEAHIGKLNDGHSKQTPALFVERGVQKHTS